MIIGHDALRNDPKLHALLAAYSALKKQKPDAEWHDRIMELPSCTTEQINKLHGLLLAGGWIETRVHGDSFKTAGRLESCYRITPDGNAALRFAGAAAPLTEEDSDDEIS